jgi:lysophospholipase L1-like esterase
MRSVLLVAAILLGVAAASIALSLWVTPMQSVTAAGQDVEVGATGPSWSLSGPGELDLFGQAIPTTVHFTGPVRPRVQLTHITLSQQLAEFTHSASHGGAQSLKDALVRGWRHYFYWQVFLVGVASVVLAGAVAGWLRASWRRSLALIAGALVLAEALDVGAIMITAYSAPAKLGRISSLQQLVGQAPPVALPDTRDVPGPDAALVVVGDSTAAGLGNRPLPHPSAADKACGRSADAFAEDLARTSGWQVTNLGCSGATIEAGLLGRQPAGSSMQPAQLDTPAARNADIVIVSVGANDLHWTDLLRACAAAPSCDDKAARAYFQQLLAAFSSDYLQLLSTLQTLPGRPVVVINSYYDPFTGDRSCLHRLGVSDGKIDTLETMLDAMNSVLERGAQAASFTSAEPDFSGHGFCSETPYVQGLHDPAPFHPTAAGQLAIALADQQALRSGR